MEKNYNELDELIKCAHWLTNEFERSGWNEISNLFQLTIDDIELWIKHNNQNNQEISAVDKSISSREAHIIHKILMKYAAISDVNQRNVILNQFYESTSK